MKRRFTLLDDVYFDALVRVRDALEAAEVPFALVGGGAVQAWVTSLRTGEGARRLGQEPILRAALRATRDLDFSTRADPAVLLAVLNGLASDVGAGAHVLGPRALRLGPVSIALTAGPDDLSGMSDVYDALLASRTALAMRRGAALEEIPTIGLAALVATKLTRKGDKAKDLLDVTQLLAALHDAGRALDAGAVRALLREDPDALALLADLSAPDDGGENG